MNTYLLVTETINAGTSKVRSQEYVSQYMPGEMADEFTAEQIADLKAGKLVTKTSRFATSVYRDMVACTRLHAPTTR